jgi:hypothetical protein
MRGAGGSFRSVMFGRNLVDETLLLILTYRIAD